VYGPTLFHQENILEEVVMLKYKKDLLLTALYLLMFVGFSTQSYAIKPSEAEFSGECVMGLAEGRHIKTDCTVTWISPENKTYCFRSGDAKTVFLQNPERNVQKAVEFFSTSDIDQIRDEMGGYTGKDVRKFMVSHIEGITKRNEDIFPLRDSILGKDLKLVYDDIDFIRTLHGYGYFPSVKFHRQDDAEKRYLIDFWIRPKQDQLSVLDTRIYKAPRRYEGKWTLWGRDPRPWWWIPASEHPGESEEKRGWEIISAIEQQILIDKNTQNKYSLTDDKTGEKIDLEFVGVHLPVRRLKKDGRYFACTDFRKHGSQNEYYDIDFWLNDEDGSIKVGDIRIHKVPEMRDGGFIQIPRYNFDDLDTEVVP